jgi:hypothetical protein
MRLGILFIGVTLCVLGAGSLTAAHATERARYAGIGSGISHTPGSLPSSFGGGAADPGRTRTAVIADGGGPAAAPAAVPGRRGWVGLDRIGAGTTQAGYGASGRGGWLPRDNAPRTASGGAAPLPADLSALPQPPSDITSDGPSPIISRRDVGGMVGLSYKIKPPQPTVERTEPVLPPALR